ncbi:MAG: hypothetical protein U1F43_30040 [Myxococcota bacterium]
MDLDAIEIVPSLVRRSRRAGLAPSRGARDRRAQRPSDQLGRRTWHVFEAQIAQDVSLGAFLDLEFPAGEGDWLIQSPDPAVPGHPAQVGAGVASDSQPLSAVW